MKPHLYLLVLLLLPNAICAKTQDPLDVFSLEDQARVSQACSNEINSMPSDLNQAIKLYNLTTLETAKLSKACKEVVHQALVNNGGPKGNAYLIDENSAITRALSKSHCSNIRLYDVDAGKRHIVRSDNCEVKSTKESCSSGYQPAAEPLSDQQKICVQQLSTQLDGTITH